MAGSVFGTPLFPAEAAGRRRVVRHYFFLHMRPVRVPAATIRFSHTWGLGGSAAVLLTVLLVSGGLQMLGYEPSPEGAYSSLLAMREGTRFGALVQSVHHWSANLLIAVAALHLLRVFFTGALDGPRRFNWVIGLGLLLSVMAANFTGYLLPWDQLSYWAVTICTGMLGHVPGIGGWLQELARGGSEVGASTLILFYTFHTTVLPVMLLSLMGLHFWRVRKAGGVVPPRPSEQAGPPADEAVDFVPNLLLREAAVGAAVVAVILLLAVFWPYQPGEPANQGMSPNPAKAPWYFLGFQELQLHFHPLFAVVVIPLAALLALLLLPYFREGSDPTAGTFLASARGRRGAATAAVAGLVATALLVVADEFLRGPEGWLPGLGPWLGNGLVPLVLLAAASALFLQLVRVRLGLRGRELDQVVFVLLAVALLVLTVTGVVFRGPGMELTWPW
jgi:quinol-cytochrome oxidoreductase complex cytochrome b subunit